MICERSSLALKMRNLIDRLEKKGWSKKEIINAVDIIKKAKHSKTAGNLFLEKRIYWILLIIIMAANFAISVALVPLLVALKGVFLYFVIIILGTVFGLLFELVIRSIEHLEKKHHQLLAIFIPAAAVANAIVISKISNNLALMLGFENIHNAIVVATVYAVSFVLPYIAYRYIFKIGYYAKG